ncbi:MAG: hypothetical protein JWO38_6671 [Gemmataceae bacterium]|nr:hypothetical protein [Gemmataceae bacterium]
MTRLSRLGFGVAAGLVLAVGVVGCGGGPKRVSVSGTVTYAGKPVPVGTVSFIGTADVIESSPITDGKYTIANAPVGPVKVTISTPAAPTGVAKKQMQQKYEGMSYDGGGDKAVVVPPKYNTPGTSDLTYTVIDAPTQSHDITLAK